MDPIRLALLENRLDREIVGLEGWEFRSVYILWFAEMVRACVIKRLLELNRILGINVPLVFRKI